MHHHTMASCLSGQNASEGGDRVTPQQGSASTGGTEGSSSQACGGTASHPDISLWMKAVKRDYPELGQKSYFVPSVHMNTTKYREEDRGGRTILVAETPDPSKTQDDLAQQHVRHCLKYLTELETMFVLSELDFRAYLKGMSLRKKNNLPRASDPELQIKQQWGLHPDSCKKEISRGDFDILIITPKWGVLAAEVKSKGFGYDNSEWNEGQTEAVVAKIRHATDQIDKMGEVIKHIWSDLNPPWRVTLILPYIDRSHLKGILEKDDELRKGLYKYIHIPESSDPCDYCLLSDDMSEKSKPWELTESVKRSLREWWTRVMSRDGNPTGMDFDIYQNLVARCAGPATEVKLRTLGEGVSYMGDQFQRFCLTPQQLDILNQDEPHLFITGPPGTGKTVVLIEKGRDWLNEGREVHIVQVSSNGAAAAKLMYVLLTEDDPDKQTKVRLHDATKEGLDHAMAELKSSAQQNPIGILMDEYKDERKFDMWRKNAQEEEQLEQLRKEVTEISGGITYDILPSKPCMEKLQGVDAKIWTVGHMPTYHVAPLLTRSLRTPETVTREVVKELREPDVYAGFRLGRTPPLPGDGMKVMAVCHLPENEEEHSGKWPADCRQCGRKLGKLLRNDLQIGREDDSSGQKREGAPSGRKKEGEPSGQKKEGEPSGQKKKGEPSCQKKKGEPSGQKKKGEPSPLHFNDVFILIWGLGLDEHQNMPRLAFLDGLHDEKIPFHWVALGDQEATDDMVRRKRNEVTVAEALTVKGLERKVVVWLQVGDALRPMSMEEARTIISYEGTYARYHMMSRCTSQLVCVCFQEMARDSGWV